MQTFQDKHIYPMLANSSSTANVTYVPSSNMSYYFIPQISRLSTVNNPIAEVTAPVSAEYSLISISKLLAVALVHTLEQLKSYNEEAIYPIASLIEPYQNTNKDLTAHMPPKSSKEVTIEVTRRGKAKPKASLD